MPTYTYKCSSCGNVEEVEHSMDDIVIKQCTCEDTKPMSKTFNQPSVHYKCGGFCGTNNK